MESTFSNYDKKKEYLLCVDSDGCAMDTMGFKHIRCFGPCMVRQWHLEPWKQKILERWNQINLYTRTRGVNRFQGLSIALQEINQQYCEIADLDLLNQWVETTTELSNDSLQEAIDRNPGAVSLKKALAWSNMVNEMITELPEQVKKPFRNVEKALAFAHQYADVAVVSSANRGAVMEEWQRCGLLAHTDLVLAQDSGSKAACIEKLLSYGYDPQKTVMCGDAMGDLHAAEENGVYYYPILAGKEAESWEELKEQGMARLLDGSFGQGYQQKKRQQFLDNFK